MHAEQRQTGRLKLLMTTDAVGGVWQYSVDLAKALSAESVEVLLATMGPRPSQSQRDQIAGVPNITLEESDYALEWMPDGLSDVVASTEWLRQLQDQFRPDVLHFNGYGHAAWSWRVPTLVVAHSCVYSWWSAVHNTSPGEQWFPYQQLVSAGLRRAWGVIAPSRSMARALATEYGIAKEAVQVIPNFSTLDSSSAVPKQPSCLAAGRAWDRAKNLQVLNGIASQLDWPIRVAGEGRARESGVSSVEWLGTIPHADLMKKMQAASIFIHPALYEPFGLSVMEAARNRCCLVLSDIDSLRELWDGSAQFVDPRDPEHWRFELNRLMRDPGERQALAARAFEHSQRYRKNNSVSAYLERYRLLALPKAEAAKGAVA